MQGKVVMVIGGGAGIGAAISSLLAAEGSAALARQGVRVNAVIPAAVMTPLHARWIAGFAATSAQLAEISARIPLGGRMTAAEEIAATVLFALSLRSGHSTGQSRFVDGGYTHLDGHCSAAQSERAG